MSNVTIPYPGPLAIGITPTEANKVKVRTLQSLLQSQGFYADVVDGVFGRHTEGGLKQFQTSHIGPNKEYLKATGVLNPDTWWALLNPSGVMQRSNLGPRVPAGLTGARKALIELCISEHRAGVKEDPDGSNYGDGVTKYLKGIGPAFWCAHFVSWCIKEVTGKWPYGERIGLVADFWNKAKAANQLILPGVKGNFPTLPQPGDLGVYRYRNKAGVYNGLGHIFIVASVSPDGRRMNTFGGNEGNRVKYGVRPVQAVGEFAGFISLLPSVENPSEVQRLLVTSDAVISDSASTR